MGTAAGEGVESLWILDGARALVQGVARQTKAVDGPAPQLLVVGRCAPLPSLVCLGIKSPVFTEAKKRALQGGCRIIFKMKVIS